MSSIAVFLVLGGATAFAATQLPANSVGTPQIKKNAVKTGKVGPEAIKAGKLAKNAVSTNRLRAGAVSTEKIADGAVTTGKLGDSAVTTGKIADDAVTGDKVKESSLGEVPKAALAANSDSLGGASAASFQQKSDILFATIAPASAAAQVQRGRGAVAVTRIATGFYSVTFDRDISGCTWLATYGQPNNAGVNAVWATVRGNSNPDELGVVLRNENGAQVDGNGFHVEVLCP
jgi:hypothetical protein